MKTLLQITLFSITVCATATPLAQDNNGNDEPQQAARLPYEVIVTPTVTRGRLQKLIIQVEDDLFAKFNELNIDDDYDVFCYEFIPTMSHIRKRVCDPAFLITARSSNSAEFASSWGACSKCIKSTPTLLPQNALRTIHGMNFEILQEKMEELTRADLEFRSIGNALAELKSRLEDFGKD